MIPFTLVPEKPLFLFSKNFLAVGRFLSSFFPLLATWLRQAEYHYNAREFSAMAFVASLFNSIFLFVVLNLIGYLTNRDFIVIAIAAAGLMFLFTLLSILTYPVIVSMRRARQIDVN